MKERRDLVQVPPTKERTEIERPFETRVATDADQYRMYRGAETAEEGIKFSDYWRAIRKRLWLVIGIAALVTTLTAIYVSRRPNYFTATATIQVDPEQDNPDLIGKDRRPNSGIPDQTYQNTQLQVLTSSSLLRRVSKELDLENNKEADLVKTEESGSTLQKVLNAIGLGAKTEAKKDEGVPIASSSSSATITGATVEDLTEAKRLQPIIEAVKKKLRVEPRRESRQASKETRLIDITYEHNSPEFAAVLVNKIAEVYTKANAEKKNKTNTETNSYLKDRIADLQTEVKQDEIKLERDKRESGVLELDKDTTLALTSLGQLNKALIDAENARKDIEAQYNAVKNSPDALTAMAEDTLARRYIDDTKLKIDELNKEKQRLLQDVTEEFPEVKALDKQIASLSKELDDYRKRNRQALLDKFKGNLDKARETENQIRVEFNKQKSEAQGQGQSAIGQKLLEDKIKQNKGLLDSLYTKQRENDVVAAGTENNVSLLDPAVAPDKPTGPARLSTVILAGILSLGFGCGLALFLEFLDDTLRTSEDIENYLRLPAIAIIPTIDSVPKRKLLLAGSSESPGNSTYEKNELLIKNDSRSSLAEAYRQLRTSVLLSTAGHAPKSLLITSSVPSEGKTTNAVNTAISLAQTGARVLIIDADMRRPRLHNIFQKPNGQGLSTILSSEMSEDEIIGIVQQEEATNLFLLPSGPIPPNPAELIGSEQMTKLIRTMERNFTHVIIDSPPIASFTDGVLISTMVDGVLLVVHAGKSSRHVVKRSRQLLLDVGAKLFGVVLNNVNIKSQENYHYYQSYQYQSHYDNQDKE